MGLQENRVDDKWICKICGLEINGKRNTIHLAVISHLKSEERKGLRPLNWLIKYTWKPTDKT